MDPSFFARGFLIGFTVALGVGPMSLLTIRRTLGHGRIYGLASGAGIAAADASYGAVAAFGLTAVTALLVGVRSTLALLGGAFLLALGVRTILATPTDRAAADDERPGLAGAFASIYGLTMTNPMTILSFAAIFAGFGLSGGSAPEAVLLVVGVFLGSMTWWLVLTSIVAAFRARLTPAILHAITRLSGVLLVGYGIAAIAVAVGLV